MNSYVAFLRGVNVGGVRIRMAKLVPAVEAMGYKEVKTYVQSGNVVYKTKSKNIAEQQSKLNGLIKKKFGYDIYVMVKTKAEVAKAIKENPFYPYTGNDKTTLHVAFTSERLGKADRQYLEGLSVPDEQFRVVGDRVYVLRKNNIFNQSQMGKNVIEKKLKVKATARNWNTLTAVAALL